MFKALKYTRHTMSRHFFSQFTTHKHHGLGEARGDYLHRGLVSAISGLLEAALWCRPTKWFLKVLNHSPPPQPRWTENIECLHFKYPAPIDQKAHAAESDSRLSAREINLLVFMFSTRQAFLLPNTSALYERETPASCGNVSNMEITFRGR